MTLAAALDRLGRIAGAAPESRALRSAALAELGRVVPFDAAVWPLTDPETSVGVAPLASVPPALMPELPRLIQLKYLTEVNRWTTLTGAARLETPAASLVWRELLHAHGVTDVASVVFRDRYGCWAFLDLWRLGGTFAGFELAFLDELAALLTPELRRCVADCFQAGDPSGTREPGPVMLLLDAGLRVLGQTPRTADYLARLLPDGEGEPVPAAAYNVAAQLVAVENGVDGQPPLARACGLAARESELLRHLSTGADTRTIAARMFLSENTVQDHLKSIFDKTGTRSRRALLSRAAGTS
ncbi:DNA-binding transcriptional regulator, CsgD family [Asanoa hainanensis]|uniref:DNA-binding transcriptional regulator, CsgD family n=1 Tax=Asanoa hainanensis TaxID=560556 RepID=A0A239M4G7_9ACTN|nr:helix-turn-helix transcriptional regulator [Asanoa hainanensis]SNT37576.1 DNA-binding transcriptional regulator, CsgD family [Asanoa hainanensis]